MTPPPGKRITRTQSQQQRIDEEMTESEQKRTAYIEKVKGFQQEFENDAEFQVLQKGELMQRISKLDKLSRNLDEIEMDMICKDELKDLCKSYSS